MPIPDFYPVPNPPPDEGEQSLHLIADAWIPIIIGLLSAMRSPRQWEAPPDDITAQVDHLIYQLEKDVILSEALNIQALHFHLNSQKLVGNTIDRVVNSGQPFGSAWRQFPAALNDEFVFFVPLAVGNYSLDLSVIRTAGSGILNIQMPDFPISWDVNLYHSSQQLDIHEILPFNVSVGGLKEFHCTVTGKDALSVGYVATITYFSIMPT